MDEQTILEILSSNDINLVLLTLSRLGSEELNNPSSLILDKVVGLISNIDLDVRHAAIFTVGIHWSYIPSFPRIVQVLHDAHEDPLVIMCAAAAVGTMAHGESSIRRQAVFELVKLVANDGLSNDIRNTAYTSALWASHRITPNEYARRSALVVQDDVDWAQLAMSLQQHELWGC